MRNEIMGFNQADFCQLGLDVNHALILRWFIDFQGTNSMKQIIIDGVDYYWVFYEKVKIDLPILRIGKDRVYRLFRELVDSGVLIKKTIKEGGTFSYYRIGPRYESLITGRKKTDPSVNIPEGVGKYNGPPSGKNTGTKILPVKIDRPAKNNDISQKSDGLLSPDFLSGEMGVAYDEHSPNKIKERWNQLIDDLKKDFPDHDLSKLSSVSSDRQKKWKKRIGEGMSFCVIIQEIRKSRFLRNGKNGISWFSFDWLIKNEGNWVMIVEGKYRDKKGIVKNEKPHYDFNKQDSDRSILGGAFKKTQE